jgi:DNA polymerase III delta prime subunit
MSELHNLVFTEKWRPSNIEDIICVHSDLIKKYLLEPKKMPSFIFYSSSPGTGKTTMAKAIAKELDCDLLLLNASDERGIDTIRDKIKGFSQSMSSNIAVKRMVFLDESDGLTKNAMDSLRNLMEEYSDNVFFVFSCNDVSKIITPIRSRCVVLGFETPPKPLILNRLEQICIDEKIQYEPEDLSQLIDIFYPDIRSMILTLQSSSINGNIIQFQQTEFKEVLDAIINHDVLTIYSKVNKNSFNILAFNRWMFKYLFDNFDNIGYEKVAKISRYLADTEKSWNLGANLNIVFIANILQVSEIFKS